LFFERLSERIAAVDSVVSVGLDPDPDRLPAHVTDTDLPRWAFNRRIIDATLVRGLLQAQRRLLRGPRRLACARGDGRVRTREGGAGPARRKAW
jgi:hypothetical protein